MLVKTESSRGHEHNEKVYLVSNGKSDFTPEDNKLMDKMCDHLKRKEILLTVLLVLLFLFCLQNKKRLRSNFLYILVTKKI